MSIASPVQEPRALNPTPTVSVIPNNAAPEFAGTGDQFNTSDVNSLTSVTSDSTSTDKEVQYSDSVIRKSRSKYTKSNWKQEKIKAWGFHFHLLCLSWYLLPIGIVLECMWLTLFLALDPTHTEVVPYTFCNSAHEPNRTCAEIIQDNPTIDCVCNISLYLPINFLGTVYMNYELTNFHQNQRDYILSVDEKQVQGQLFDKNCKPIQPSKECKPFMFANNVSKIPIYPCGRYPNSLFSDDAKMWTTEGKLINWQPVHATGSDKVKDKMFVRPLKSSKCTLQDLQKGFSKPRHWSKVFWDEFIHEGGVRSERFIIWMRPAAFSTFRIPYRYFNDSLTSCGKNSSNSKKMHGICKGNYTIEILYRFDTASFAGEKNIVLVQRSFITDTNNFLCITSATVGSISTCIGLVALFFRLMEKAAIKQSRRKIQQGSLSTSLLIPIDQPLIDTSPLPPLEPSKTTMPSLLATTPSKTNS